MASPVLDLDQHSPAQLTYLANRLAVGANALYREKFGVGVTEWRIMSLLAAEAPIPAARVCQVLGLDKGPVSRCLAGMEQAGHVRVKPDRDDARRRPVALTGPGRRLHDRIIKLELAREEKLMTGLKPAERKSLLNLLTRLRANLATLAE
jgi:DNA-binding MarR family transcriptional regulator